MARPDQEAIDTFISIAGVSEAAAIQKLEEHHGNLNEAVNAYFGEGDRNRAQVEFTNPHDDVMDIDNVVPGASLRPPSSQHPFTGDLNPFSLRDPNFPSSIYDSGPNIASRPPFLSHPRNVREVPVEVKDGDGTSGQTGRAPVVIDDVSETGHNHGSEIRGTVVLENADDVRSTANAPIVDLPDHSNDIEEEMVRAAIEASKQDAAMSSQGHDHLDLGNPAPPQPVQSQLEDAELAHAVSLSLQTAEREIALREPKVKDSVSELDAQMSSLPEETRKVTSSNGRPPQLEHGSTSIPNESEDVEDLQLFRHRRRRVTSNSSDIPSDNGGVEVSSPSSIQQNENVHNSQNNGSDFSSEWGGITSEEHDEAVMLEAAMFGGVPEQNEFRFPTAAHQLMQNDLDQSFGPFPRPAPRPPSPSLTAQRLIREQQDDEYLAALQADREKELKAKEEAEAALAEERLKEEEFRQQLQQQEEIERQIVAKEVSLPQEPKPDDENAVTLLVRMPDGSRRGRRFLKSDKLQNLFDFIDVGRVMKPGSYRLVRPYPRRAFGNEELSSSLNELGLTSKQEALYLELI